MQDWCQRMDNLDLIGVRFHFNGEFLNFGMTFDYVGGDEGMSFVERDKVSLLEIKGHLRDHVTVTDDMTR